MNLHEYQAKELLKKYQVPVQEGIPVDNAGAAEEAYKQLKVQYGNNFAVVKAQIHAGGRGKGKIQGTDQRGWWSGRVRRRSSRSPVRSWGYAGDDPDGTGGEESQ